jgi:hypothetical protein
MTEAAPALSPPFPPAVTRKWVKTKPLDDWVKDLAAKQFPSMGISVVDVSLSSRTGSTPGFLAYGGAQDDVDHYAGSLPKIAAMYAAYRLRERLTKAAAGLTDKTADEVIAKVEAAWKPIVSTAFPGKPADFPKLKRIFSITGGPGAWTFEFKNDNMSWEALNARHGGRIPSTRGFYDRMKLAIGWSDNGATGTCVEDIGRQYLNGALANDGFYDRGSQHGLWLSGNYDGVESGAWEKKPDSVSAQTATAASVAWFLTLMETDRLVDADSSKDMRENIMGEPWFIDTLNRNKRPVAPAPASYGKVGIDGGRSTDRHDCAVLTRTEPGWTFRYVVVALNAKDNATLNDLIIKLDDFVKKFETDWMI